MFKTSPYAITGIGKEFFVYGVPINDARIDAIDYAVITGELYWQNRNSKVKYSQLVGSKMEKSEDKKARNNPWVLYS